jgi:hypothetical protein
LGARGTGRTTTAPAKIQTLKKTTTKAPWINGSDITFLVGRNGAVVEKSGKTCSAILIGLSADSLQAVSRRQINAFHRPGFCAP